MTASPAELWTSIVACVCEASGLQMQDLAAPGYGSRAVSQARALAIYIAAVEFEICANQVAALAGRAPSLVSMTVANIEEARELASFDELVDQLAGDVRRGFRCEPGHLARVA